MKIGATSRTLMIAGTLLLVPATVDAQVRDLGEIATGLATQTTQIATFVSVLAFVLGVVMAIMGFLKFRAHAQNPNDPSAKISTAFMLVFVGSMLVALPAALGSGIQTIFGDGAATTDAITGFSGLD
jgi:uncharacterized membrane protein